MNNPAAPPKRFATTWQRFAVMAIAVALIVVFVQNRESLSLDSLIQKQQALRSTTEQHPALILGSAFLLYVVVTGLSLPGAALMTIIFGWLFGFWPAVVLVSFASTAGATIAFLLSRFLFRDAIQNRFGDRLAAFNAALASEGAFYLLTLRMLPHVPFFLVNLVMGLTPIRTSTFWWASQLGMLPGTCVYVYAGTSVASLEVLRDKGLSGILTWQLALAFVLLGLFPLIAKRLISMVSTRAATPASEK